MPKFRKKPVVIEAFQVPDDIYEAVMWIKDREGLAYFNSLQQVGFVQTLEGEMRFHPGDYIIQGVSGELYPCKADIFALTYEAVDER